MAQDKTRRQDLDRAKGLGILLVVLGHIVARTPPEGNDWYVALKDAIYHFHMPFFMYLSGYTTFLSGASRAPPGAWRKLIGRRASRLLVPFLLFGVAILVGKSIAAHFVFVDNAPHSFIQGLIGLLWYTDTSPAVSVWYIFVLFVLCVATPVILHVTGNRTYLLVAIAAILYVLPVPHILFLDRVTRFYLFFAIGGLAADAGQRWLTLMDRFAWWALAALGVSLIAIPILAPTMPAEVSLLICGVLSMPALHGLIRTSRLSSSSTLLRVGAYSFVIYLLNTPFIGLLKGAMLAFFPWDGPNFLIYAPLLMAAGTLGPMWVKHSLLRHAPPLDRMTD